MPRLRQPTLFDVRRLQIHSRAHKKYVKSTRPTRKRCGHCGLLEKGIVGEVTCGAANRKHADPTDNVGGMAHLRPGGAAVRRTPKRLWLGEHGPTCLCRAEGGQRARLHRLRLSIVADSSGFSKGHRTEVACTGRPQIARDVCAWPTSSSCDCVIPRPGLVQRASRCSHDHEPERVLVALVSLCLCGRARRRGRFQQQH